MLEEMVKITSEDGHIFDAFHAKPEGIEKGAVVILQEIFGMTEQLKNVARYWASQGYCSILPAMYDRIKASTVIPFSDMETAQGMMKQLDPDKVLYDIKSSVEYVENGRGVSLIGFCWGGGAAARMASLINIRGAVSYYGTMLTENTAGGAKCSTLFHFGENDPHSPTEIIELVKKNIPSAELFAYEAGHAFANDARPDFYFEAATLDARSRTLSFLDNLHNS
ncbi:dienelactone hydrolase family protein [Rhodospirillales bacterium]|nr:dienelactone hydrolase family protein [Rhodospirillales bacterium]